MIDNILLILSLCGFALGIMACGILVFSNKTHRLANHLLVFSLFSLAVILLMTFLLKWNINYYAYVYRFPTPVFFLTLPAAYLYIRTIIYDVTRLRKSDFIHFLPAMLCLIEIFPFYFTSYEHRLALVREMINNPKKLIEIKEGILPPYFHTVLLFVLGVIYIILMFRTLNKGSKIVEGNVHINRTSIFKWMQTFTSLIALISIPMIFVLFVSPATFMNGTQFLQVTITVTFLIINLYLFLRPEILYGIPKIHTILSTAPISPIQSENDLNVNQNTIIDIKIEADPQEKKIDDMRSALLNLENYRPVLELYIATAKPFLKQGYTIYDLSKETNIPQHHLSGLLNKIYRMRFTEFMNRMRIDYIKENFGNPEWDNLTLEGIAKQAGFSSRTTFFNTIKKTTGLAPSEFVSQIKSSPQKTD
jgi:AraC-like DNA-binding protein